MATSKAIILISFTLVWLSSLFVLALATPDVVNVEYNINQFYPYVNEAYNMIPPNVIMAIVVISLLLISRYLFRL